MYIIYVYHILHVIQVVACGRISAQCMSISEIKYFSIICLGKFFHLRKLVVQNLYGFVWTIKICFAKKKLFVQSGENTGKTTVMYFVLVGLHFILC